MRTNWIFSALICCLGMLMTGEAFAASTTLPQVNAGFDITGYIQSATVSQAPGAVNGDVPNRLRGGTLTINGVTMIVPNNSIVQMPAASFSWADLFGLRNSTAIGQYDPPRPTVPRRMTGLALEDPTRLHFPAYEIRVVGNIINDPDTNTQTYIVGMILPVAQSQLGSGSGYINYIDYDGSVLGMPGRFRVGGIIDDPTTGTLCELNDPVGRYGAAHSPDPRFTVDYQNPTVTAATGYPVGIPTVAPSTTQAPPLAQIPTDEEGDPDRPYWNRPPNGIAAADGTIYGTDPFLDTGAPLKSFTMPVSSGPGATKPDPYKQVPLMVGDWVDYSGTLMLIDPSQNAARPDPSNQFVSVYALTAHLGIRTTEGTQPAYAIVEEFLFGTGDVGNTGPTVAGIGQETSTRVALVAFTTDTDQNLGNNDAGGAILGIYVDPTTGQETELQFPNGSTALSPPGSDDEFAMDNATRGRIRWNPAKNGRKAQPGGLVRNITNPGQDPGVAGDFNYYREYVFKLTGPGRGTMQLPDQVQPQPDGTPLPGLIAGQYRLPIFDYIFGEGTNFGEPIPPFNFHEFGFLAIGSGRLDGDTGPVVGPLDPFPTFQ